METALNRLWSRLSTPGWLTVIIITGWGWATKFVHWRVRWFTLHLRETISPMILRGQVRLSQDLVTHPVAVSLCVLPWGLGRAEEWRVPCKEPVWPQSQSRQARGHPDPRQL